MNHKEVAEKLIDSYSIAHFALGNVLYDKVEERDKALRNARIIVDLQIKLIKSNSKDSVIDGFTNLDLDFWEKVNKEIK